MIERGGVEVPLNSYSTNLGGLQVFDVSRGVLLSGSYRVDGAATTSSAVSEGGPGATYVAIGQLTYLEVPSPKLPFYDEDRVLAAVRALARDKNALEDDRAAADHFGHF